MELFAAAEVEWLAPPALGPPACPLIELRMSASIPFELEVVELGKTELEVVRWRAR